MNSVMEEQWFVNQVKGQSHHAQLTKWRDTQLIEGRTLLEHEEDEGKVERIIKKFKYAQHHEDRRYRGAWKS